MVIGSSVDPMDVQQRRLGIKAEKSQAKKDCDRPHLGPVYLKPVTATPINAAEAVAPMKATVMTTGATPVTSVAAAARLQPSECRQSQVSRP